MIDVQPRAGTGLTVIERLAVRKEASFAALLDESRPGTELPAVVALAG